MLVRSEIMIKRITVLPAIAVMWGVLSLLLLQDVFSSPMEPLFKDEPGCLTCHKGITIINDKMQPYLLSFAQQKYGKGRGYECAICHEGDPTTATKAHEGFIPNPSSMWVLHLGKGCAKCHDSKGSITTLLAKPLPAPVGGELLSMAMTSSDPSGKTGTDYTYRMSRALMSLETGKASKILSSNGVIDKGTFPYADFDMDDPDGSQPRVGSDAYKQWVNKAMQDGYLRRLEKTEEIPDFDSGLEVFGSEEKAGFSDTHRKQCARCHVWGEGRDKRGDLRASGCASCHVLYGNDGTYEGKDAALIREESDRPHPLKHQITVAIPGAQCTHCHTRGKRIGTSFVGMFEYDYQKDGKAPPFNHAGNPQQPLFSKEYSPIRKDVHFERGLQCSDCHTSIDVHGDGNIYPVTFYQVEVSCYDCHGTPDKYPWELPVGYGTPVTLEGERGVYTLSEKEYLITSRGNTKRNWLREGTRAYLVSYYTERKHEIPLLKNVALPDTFKTQQGKVAMATISRHIETMECFSCHSSWAPQCYGCHMQYDRRVKGTDWINTSKKVDPETGRQTITREFGDISIENRAFLRWERPILGVNLRGKVSPIVPGCQVFYTFTDDEGNIKALNKNYQTSTGHNNPTLAPLNPHTTSLVARSCEECHVDPKAVGYGTGNTRSKEQLIGEDPLFHNLAEGAFGDIPGAETATWQVPRIEHFPYTLDQAVTRDGKQIINMPLLEDRPLNEEERGLIEREGVCMGCHQYYNTPGWEKIIEKYGRAETAEQHEQMVSEAIKLLMKETP